jgi:hypothetical protein
MVNDINQFIFKVDRIQKVEVVKKKLDIKEIIGGILFCLISFFCVVLGGVLAM